MSAFKFFRGVGQCTLRNVIVFGVSLLLLASCKQEETRPSYETQVASRAKGVQQAERKRWEAQQQEQASQSTGAQSPDATPSGQAGAAASAAPKPAYLPPSEQGAEVEITETPLDGSSPPVKSAAAQPAASPLGDQGGNMPSGVSATPSAAGATAPGVPPAGATGSAASKAGPPLESVATPQSTAAARTSAEQGAALNQELQRKLREFDQLMRKAQENASRERAAQTGGGTPEGELSGQGARLEQPPEGADGAGGAANRASGLGNTPDQSGDTRRAHAASGGGGAAVRLPDGDDDDVVARQLREAAERESDPVLRDKLWDEYRKYKGG